MDAVLENTTSRLSSRASGSQLAHVKVVVSMVDNPDYLPHQCSDSNPTTFCIAAEAPAPWVALYLGSRARVDKVEIRNRPDCCGKRLRDFEVRVTDSLPPSGAPLVLF